MQMRNKHIIPLRVCKCNWQISFRWQMEDHEMYHIDDDVWEYETSELYLANEI